MLPRRFISGTGHGYGRRIIELPLPDPVAH